MADFDVVTEKLLGMKSSREIADFLQDQGVTGEIEAAGNCPIANYYRQETGHKKMLVTETFIRTGYIGEPAPHKVNIELTVLGRFVREFDTGKYPNLVRPK